MNTYTITSPSVLWECGKVEDFSIFPQNIKKKDVMDCIQECSYKNSGFCIINKKHDSWTILSHIRTDTITFLRNQKDNLNKNINHAKNNFIIFLFDEMSYEYLFKNGEIDPRYVNFKRFADISEVYHAA